jgi:hypothetical protein
VPRQLSNLDHQKTVPLAESDESGTRAIVPSSRRSSTPPGQSAKAKDMSRLVKVGPPSALLLGIIGLSSK